jgi:hypothetical protein
MTHLSLTEGGTEWGDHVTDAECNSDKVGAPAPGHPPNKRQDRASTHRAWLVRQGTQIEPFGTLSPTRSATR